MGSSIFAGCPSLLPPPSFRRLSLIAWISACFASIWSCRFWSSHFSWVRLFCSVVRSRPSSASYGPGFVSALTAAICASYFLIYASFFVACSWRAFSSSCFFLSSAESGSVGVSAVPLPVKSFSICALTSAS